ncbi:MAG: type IX secretion system membrane protein PorP/SprF [Flavobacteriales bacterium]|nr:type IX secretion system membrane protein PorP/SprF [Flavobacteriales bacterium]
MKNGKYMYRISYVLIAMVLLVVDARAQDPEFSQFYATPVYTNPAMAGTGQCDGGGRAVINYRNQWPSLPGTFVTTAVSWDQHFDRLGGGIGIIATRDVAGEGLLETNTVSGIYAYQLRLNKSFTMRFGLEAQFMQRGLDFSKLRFEDQIQATRGFVLPTSEPVIDNKIRTPNFSTGLLGYTENFYAGVAVHNLIEPNQSFYGDPEAVLPMRYTVHAGSVIPLDRRRNPKSTISPNALFMMQNKFTQLNLGFYINRGPLVTGLWYRQTFGEFKNSDALMVLVGFRKDKFKFGYSYDLTVSDARAAAPGSHEISVAVEWCARRPQIRYKPLNCPDF